MDSLDPDSASNQTIFIAAGTYKEQVSVPELAGSLYILGETPDTTTYTENTVLVTQSLSQDDGGDNDSTGKASSTCYEDHHVLFKRLTNY